MNFQLLYTIYFWGEFFIRLSVGSSFCSGGDAREEFFLYCEKFKIHRPRGFHGCQWETYEIWIYSLSPLSLESILSSSLKLRLLSLDIGGEILLVCEIFASYSEHFQRCGNCPFSQMIANDSDLVSFHESSRETEWKRKKTFLRFAAPDSEILVISLNWAKPHGFLWARWDV